MSTSRTKLPETRTSVTHKATVGTLEFYITVGLYEDGQPGELFIKMDNPHYRGWCNVFGLLISMCLQHGIPLETLVDKLSYQCFLPDGFSGDELGYARSIPDYVIRWMHKQWGKTTIADVTHLGSKEQEPIEVERSNDDDRNDDKNITTDAQH